MLKKILIPIIILIVTAGIFFGEGKVIKEGFLGLLSAFSQFGPFKEKEKEIKEGPEFKDLEKLKKEISEISARVESLEGEITRMTSEIKEIKKGESLKMVKGAAEEKIEREKKREERTEIGREKKKEERKEEERGKSEEKIKEKEEINKEEEKEVKEPCQKMAELSPLREKIIFNEIAWMGTAFSSSDEWIELKNISPEAVNLANWQILDKAEQIKIFFTDRNKVLANDFFLLERTDDNTLPQIPADFIYTGALNDTDEALYLFDENCQLQDFVSANPDWPAGEKVEKRSMERTSDLSWQTYSYDFGPEGIFGTPKKENSQPFSFRPPPRDLISPEAFFSPLSSLQINPSFTISWSGSDSAQEGVAASGIDNFQLRYSEDKENWHDLYSGLATQYNNFSGENEKTYYFQLRAKDKAGNLSQWQEIFVEINNLPIAISEIAWMGTKASANDEWLELFNNTNQEIDLSEWKILAKDGQPKINLEGKISSKGFFLLERTENTVISDILADQIYTGGLDNEGEELELRDKDNNLIDQVSCQKDEKGKCKAWPAGKNEKIGKEEWLRVSMERINPKASGSDLANWGDNNQTLINGLDAAGNPINGTPRSKNSLSI